MGGQASRDPGDAALLRRVQVHVANNLTGDLRVATLARVAGMSASCFHRWFRGLLGVTPHAYVLDARLARAKELLRETDLPLVEVALAVGFTSQACLNVAFRRRAGVTPGRYREEISRKAKDAIPRGR